MPNPQLNSALPGPVSRPMRTLGTAFRSHLNRRHNTVSPNPTARISLQQDAFFDGFLRLPSDGNHRLSRSPSPTRRLLCKFSVAMASDGEQAKVFTLQEVAQHVVQEDCWMVIHGKVSSIGLKSVVSSSKCAFSSWILRENLS